MQKDNYQHGFSELYSDSMYNTEKREQKAKKMLAVLRDYFGESLKEKKLLDIGSSTGIISHYLSQHLKKVIGTDIDTKAVQFAREKFQKPNLDFFIRDAMDLKFSRESFDIVTCAQIYEHVPDSQKLMDEIYRVLKPGGVCFFSAGNRLMIIEAHHKLPFLTYLPRSLANLYVRLFSRGEKYYETHLTYGSLKKLVSQFKVFDYTTKVVKDPEKYCATELITPSSVKQKIALFVLTFFYWFFPNYLWMLQKPKT